MTRASMRLTATVLMAFLSLHFVEISPMLLRFKMPNPKTCCGRAVCLCTHAKGSFCPFKKPLPNRQDDHAHRQSICHLKGKLLAAHAAPRPEPGLFLKKAPCHADQPKASLPNVAKEFDFNFFSQSGESEESDFFFRPRPRFPDFLFDHRLGKPPKIIFPAFSF